MVVTKKRPRDEFTKPVPKQQKLSRRPPNSSLSSTLCQRCASIKFERVYKIEPGSMSSKGTPIFDMGFVSSTDLNSSCPFCGMVARILSENSTVSAEFKQTPIYCHLRAFNCLAALGLARIQSRLASSPSVVVAVIPHSRDVELSLLTRDAALATGLILPTTNINSSDLLHQPLPYFGRRVTNDRINYDVLKQWIRDCCDDHPACLKIQQNSSRSEHSFLSKGKPLVVIDCETRVMTKLPARSSYVALSYVWGPQALASVAHSVQENEKLPYPQPATIEDAITVVKRLGGRHLWIDRYSINQSDEAAKVHAILNMAEIFEHAHVTLVSLARDVSTGLWGVSHTHRRKQPHVDVGKLQLVSSGPVLEDVLLRSVWSTRGWTLQEALLSRRMLLFSEDQVYWKCPSITQREAVQQPRAANAVRKKTGLSLDPDIFSEANQYRKRFGEMLLPLYTRQVAEYTKRRLTYGSDAINAFRALLSRSKETTFWGIPIFMIDEKSDTGTLREVGFLLGLLWSRSAHQWYKPWQEFDKSQIDRAEPRDEFPSWSWTSTGACVQFDPLSFSLELSNRYGRLHAWTHRHYKCIGPYANIDTLAGGTLVSSIEAALTSEETTSGIEGTLESILPPTLRLTGLLVSWRVDQTHPSPDGSSTFNVAFQLPDAIALSAEHDWLRRGILFLDFDMELDTICHPDFIGSAMLMVHYRRDEYNWRNVFWWMALKPQGRVWRRMGLIRSVHEVSEPQYRAKDSRSDRDKEHVRPFLPPDRRLVSDKYNPPDKITLEEYFESIDLI